MSKPPESSPHSDIDGIHQSEKKNRDTAQETGETTADLSLDESVGKPPHTDQQGRDENR